MIACIFGDLPCDDTTIRHTLIKRSIDYTANDFAGERRRIYAPLAGHYKIGSYHRSI